MITYPTGYENYDPSNQDCSMQHDSEMCNATPLFIDSLDDRNYRGYEDEADQQEDRWSRRPRSSNHPRISPTRGATS